MYNIILIVSLQYKYISVPYVEWIIHNEYKWFPWCVYVLNRAYG